LDRRLSGESLAKKREAHAALGGCPDAAAMACRPEGRSRLPGPQETKPMGHSDGSLTAMKNFLSAKAAGLFRRFSPRLPEDYKLADYARCHILPIAPSQPDPIRNAPLTMIGAKGINLDL